MSTQTDPVEILPLEKLNLIKYDKETVAILKDALFWYEGLENPGRIEFLKQRQKDIEARLNVEGINKFSDPNVKSLAEHILLISKKILESYKHIQDVRTSETQTIDTGSTTIIIKTPETTTPTDTKTPPVQTIIPSPTPQPTQITRSWNDFSLWLHENIIKKESEAQKYNFYFYPKSFPSMTPNKKYFVISVDNMTIEHNEYEKNMYLGFCIMYLGFCIM